MLRKHSSLRLLVCIYSQERIEFSADVIYNNNNNNLNCHRLWSKIILLYIISIQTIVMCLLGLRVGCSPGARISLGAVQKMEHRVRQNSD